MLKQQLQAVALGLLLGCSGVYAATTATAMVTYTVGSVDAVTVSGNPGVLSISSATAGNQPTNAVDSSTTYAVTSNNSSRQIKGALSIAMPTGVTLSVSLTPPTGATTAGSVSLTTTAQSLVTGISNVAQGSLAVTYTLTSSVNASQVNLAANTLTYTIGP